MRKRHLVTDAASAVSPELLAPAGGPNAFRAAIASGADAVYLGIETLNARRGAENFTLESLAETCRFAHVRGVRVYLTVNVVVLAAELPEALALIDRAWAAGVDAVIVQDLGVLRVVREVLPQVRLHASTQFNTHSSSTVGVLAARGASRVTLARETSLKEIGQLAGAGARSGVQVETFVHGALCVCYSGQCLFSSLVGGRSANRGQCAQPCRLPYELVDERGGVLAAPGDHLLSPKDLAGVTILDRLVGSGVSALKIEGRMKSAEYVAVVTGVYRKAVDRIAADPANYRVTDAEIEVLGEAFNRGFSEAYFSHERGNRMMSYSRPNNRGVLVGRIGTYHGPTATVTLDAPVDSADTIEVWTSRGRFAQHLGAMSIDGGVVHTAPAKATVSVTLEKPAGAGDRVFRVRNASLMSAAARTFQNPSGHVTGSLDITVRMVLGEPLEVSVADLSGRRGTSRGAVLEPARTRPVTAEDVVEHVGRLGGTAYEAGEWDVTLSPGAGAGFSALHAVRREAIEDYESKLLSDWAGRTAVHPELPGLARPYRNLEPAPRLVASVSSLAAANSAIQAGCESAYVPAWALTAGAAIPRGVVPYLPRVTHDREEPGYLDRIQDSPVVVAGTLGLIDAASKAGHRVEAHWSLNVTNAYAVAELADIGASFVWLSPELSSRQIAQIGSEAVVPVGVAVSGRQEVMVTEHCILMAEGECKQGCDACKRRTRPRMLRDRKGYEFPVITDPAGRSHIYNSVPLDLTSAFEELLSTGVSALRIDLDTVPPPIAAAWVARVREALQNTLAGRAPVTPEKGTVTAGHFFRGVS